MKVLQDAKSSNPVLQHIYVLLKNAEQFCRKNPSYELDILRQNQRLMLGVLEEFLGAGATEIHYKNKHKFFEKVIQEIEDLTDLGFKEPVMLNADTLEHLWKTIPDSLTIRIVVVRFIIEKMIENKSRGGKVQGSDYTKDDNGDL